MLDALLTQVTDRAGIDVHKRSDCELLSSLIEEETGQFMSYNTLRRMYGLATPVRPHRSTLDVLSRFCGFRDYAHFSSSQPKLNRWRVQALLHEALADEQVSSVTAFFESHPQDLAGLGHWLEAVRALLLARRWSDLVTLLDAGFYTPDTHPYTYQLHVANSLGHLLRQMDLTDVPGKVLTHPSMVEGVYLRLVDYSALNGYYGAWTRLVEASNPSAETTAFIQCLRVFQGFLNGTRLEIDTSAIALDSCPPPLLGRLFSVDVLQNNVWDPEALDDMWGAWTARFEVKREEVSAYHEPSLLALTLGQRQLTAWLAGRVQIAPDTIQEFQAHDLHVHFLLQAQHALFEGKRREAQAWFKRVDPSQFRRPSFWSFLQFPLKRIEAGVQGFSSPCPASVQREVARMGHVWFNEDLWDNWFDPGRVIP